jgi:Spy/CpxP family protein refolding chaperone
MNKKIWILLAGTLIASQAIATEPTVSQTPTQAAQVETRPEFGPEHHKKMAEKLAADLNLTEDQIAVAERLREESRKKIEPLMQQMGDLRQQIDAERRANMEAFEKILTPEQKTRFDQIRKDGPERMRGKMMRGMHRVGPEDDRMPPQMHDDPQGDHPRFDHPRHEGKNDKDKPDKGKKHGEHRGADKRASEGGFVED